MLHRKNAVGSMALYFSQAFGSARSKGSLGNSFLSGFSVAGLPTSAVDSLSSGGFDDSLLGGFFGQALFFDHP